MNTHWWRYFNASARNFMKYQRMRALLLSHNHWYAKFPTHFHYDVSLDEFYRFLEQALDEFQIPRTILSDFRRYTRQTDEHHQPFHLKSCQTAITPQKAPGIAILRI